MADNYKILAQTTAASIEENSGLNQANAVYTVPENTQASISSISLINTSNIDQEYSIGFLSSAEAESAVDSSVTYQTGVKGFLATSSRQSVGFSENGLDWTTSNMPKDSEWSAVAYGDGKFVAVVDRNTFSAYSSDGITWSESVLPANTPWTSVAYGNGVFVAGSYSSSEQDGSSISAYSEDGITWTLTSIPTPYVSEIVFYQNKFVAFGAYDFAYSTNGLDWTMIYLQLPPYWFKKSVAYNADSNILVAGSYSDVVVISGDITGEAGRSIQWVPGPSGLNSLVYGNGKFVSLVADYGNTDVYTSTDGVTWTYNYFPASWVRNIAFGDNKFIALGLIEQFVAYSSDGVTWELSFESGFTSATRLIYVDQIQINNASLYELPVKNTIVPTRSIQPNQVDEIVGGITLSAGDQVRVYSESEDLIVQVYGVEIA